MLNAWNHTTWRKPEPVYYEVVLKHPDRGRFLFMYAQPRIQETILEALLKNTRQVTEFTGSYDWYLNRIPEAGLYSTNGWTLFFSGRHERDAKRDELQHYLA